MKRIIPADAGSTCPILFTVLHSQDHPRGCGEHYSNILQERFAWGSSPRMRGAPEHYNNNGSNRRIIPADAGSTLFSALNWFALADHPRGCGEHQQQQTDYNLQQGSSPRMRGAHSLAGLGGTYDRIIPADAGSTASQSQESFCERDHPRGCGEHLSVSPGWTM